MPLEPAPRAGSSVRSRLITRVAPQRTGVSVPSGLLGHCNRTKSPLPTLARQQLADEHPRSPVLTLRADSPDPR